MYKNSLATSSMSKNNLFNTFKMRYILIYLKSTWYEIWGLQPFFVLPKKDGK